MDEDLEKMKADLASMTQYQQALFTIARGEILQVLQRFPGVGLMAVAYVVAEEAAKIPDAPGATP